MNGFAFLVLMVSFVLKMASAIDFDLLKLPAKKAGTWKAEMNSMTNKIKRFLTKVLSLSLLASWSLSFAEDVPDQRLAGKNAVYETAEQIFATSWMPKDTSVWVITLMLRQIY